MSTTYVLGRQHGRRAGDADEVDAVAVAVLVGQVVPQVAAVDGDLVRVRVRARVRAPT